MLSRRFIAVCLLLGIAILGWLAWRNFSSRQSGETSVPAITKQPIAYVSRSFDPVLPPADMPPLSPGETALCDSDFLSDASVRGVSRQADATHAIVTVTQIRMTLQLNIDVWLPTGANQHLTEHEEGHRQISEYYYQTADKLAAQIATTYMGRQVEIAGADLNAESTKALQQLARDITAEYSKELNPNPAQLLFDSITDHGRNDVAVKDAVAHAIKNASIEASSTKASAPQQLLRSLVHAAGRMTTRNTGSVGAIFSNSASGASLSTGTCGRAPGARCK